MIKITYSEQYGREVTSKTELKAGQVLFDAELLILSEQDTKTVNTTDLQYYTFKFNEAQDCLVLGHGEIFNHSDTPNVSYDLVESEGRTKMRFTLIKDVSTNEQLFIDYNKDVTIDSSSYVNKNMVG